MLGKSEKDKHESILEFETRFLVAASTFREDQHTEGRKQKLLFIKFPRDLQRQLAIFNFQECTIQKLNRRVEQYLDWMSVGDQKLCRASSVILWKLTRFISATPISVVPQRVVNLGRVGSV